MSPKPWPARENAAYGDDGLRFTRRLMLFLCVANAVMLVLFVALAHPMLIGSFIAAVACGYYYVHLGDEIAR